MDTNSTPVEGEAKPALTTAECNARAERLISSLYPGASEDWDNDYLSIRKGPDGLTLWDDRLEMPCVAKRSTLEEIWQLGD